MARERLLAITNDWSDENEFLVYRADEVWNAIDDVLDGLKSDLDETMTDLAGEAAGSDA